MGVNMENSKSFIDYRTMTDIDLDNALRYPDHSYFDGMPYNDWLHCIKLNPMIIGYTNQPEIHHTPEVVAHALSLNPYLLNMIKGYELGYFDYMEIYRVGKMGLIYNLYEHIDINDVEVQHAIEDAKYEEVVNAYKKYIADNEMVESMDSWSIFRDLYVEKRDILESVRGISDYYNYTLCRKHRDNQKISTEAFSYHNDPEKLSTIMLDIAKEIINKHGNQK